MDVWNLVKGSGVAIVSAIVLSGNTAIATINQGVTLENNLNAPSLNTSIQKSNTLRNDGLKINPNNKQTQFQNMNVVGKKKVLILGCRPNACG